MPPKPVLVDAQSDENHPDNKKRDYEENFDGIVKTRSCTDVICLVLFAVCVAAQIALAVFALTYGRPDMLLLPTDSQGNACGNPESSYYRTRPYLQTFDIVNCARLGPAVVFTGCATPEVCLNKCPDKLWSWTTLEEHEKNTGSPDKARRQAELICVDSFDAISSKLTIKKIIEAGYCAPYYLPSQPIFNRCMPVIQPSSSKLMTAPANSQAQEVQDAQGRSLTADDVVNGNLAMLKFYQIGQWFHNAISDLSSAWPIIVLSLIFAGLLAMFWAFLMRYFSGVMVYVTLSTFLLVFTGATIYCTLQYFFRATTSRVGQFVIATDINVYLDLKEFWMGLAISGLLLTLIIVIILLFLRNRIKLAVAIIGQASRAVGSMSATLLAPLAPYLLEIFTISMWLTITIYLSSMGKAEFARMPNSVLTAPVFNFQSETGAMTSVSAQSVSQGQACRNVTDPGCHFVRYSQGWYVYGMHAYNLFMSIWLLCFLEGCNAMVLAGAFASWYWVFDKKKHEPKSPITGSIWRLVRYHLGTVAFGSILLAIVKFLRAILMWIQARLKGTENACARCMICCCQCFMWCLENFLRFLTRNAYIVTAMQGKGFCSAAKDSFFLITRNCLRLLVVDSVTTFILFVGKLVITALVAVASYYLLSTDAHDVMLVSGVDGNKSLNYFYVPLVVCALGSYTVCCLFFGVFALAVDTLFICVMEDLERNDGTPEKPYYMSKSLKKVLKIKNQDAKSQEKTPDQPSDRTSSDSEEDDEADQDETKPPVKPKA